MAHKPVDRWIVPVGMLAVLVGLAALLACLFPAQPVQAKPLAGPLLQDATAYPNPEPTEEGYPFSTDTPEVGDATATAPADPPWDETLPALPTSTQTPTATVTATLAPNMFLTEDAQMQGAQVTPAASETPGPTLTPYQTATATRAAAPAATPAAKDRPGGIQIDWGMFWIGFSIPVLAGCGFVLYLLDRRPNLFKPRSQ